MEGVVEKMQALVKLGLAGIVGAAALPMMTPSSAEASVLEVHFTGMDLYMGFDGKRNIQTGPVAGQIDTIDAATFYIDETSIGTLVGDMTAAVGIAGFDIPVAGGSDSNDYKRGYFTLDFDTTTHEQGWLDLAVDDSFIVTAFYTGDEVGLTLVGTNTGIKTQQDLTDRLPAWPGFDEFETIKFSFSSSRLSDLDNDGSILTRFRAGGSGTMTQIPEPGSLALAGIGGLALLRRRRP